VRVIIIGCGIGGAATSLGLSRAGISHVVLEQAGELAEVGAGLQMSPNAMRVLRGLGLGDDISRFGVQPAAHRFTDWRSGEVLMQTPLMPLAEEVFGAPYLHAHRADLLNALVSRMAPDAIRLNATVESVEQTRDGVTAHLRGGGVETGDVLIGADGIHSLVREQVFRPDPPRDSGCVAWRGLVPAKDAQALGFERNSYIWMGPDRSMVLYYVRGGDLFNWVGIGPFNAEARESWSAKGSKAAALREYDGWHAQITGLIEATDSLFMTALNDRDPLESWVEGRIALMGDAAHAMMPFHAQGAAQSIEDSWVLSRCLEDASDRDVPVALKKYETLRLARANRVQQQSRAAEHLFHMTDADEIARRNARFARHGASDVASNQANNQGSFPPGQQWLFAYDAEKAVRGDDDEWRALSW
jgi:salicylate hydroxylase